jgi:acyl-CoA dehydrogenase
MDNEPSGIDRTSDRKRNIAMAKATAERVTAHISPPILPFPGDIKLRAEATAAAAAHADAVDRAARFPCEAFAAARAERLMSLLVPVELGGEGANVSDAVDVCYVLGRACASTAMVFAMHQIMVAILVRHARDNAWHRRMLQRLSAEQWLLASSTTEGTGGGDLRASACAVRVTGGRMALEKNATVMSYGAEADAILTTARRSRQRRLGPGAGRAPQE